MVGEGRWDEEGGGSHLVNADGCGGSSGWCVEGGGCEVGVGLRKREGANNIFGVMGRTGDKDGCGVEVARCSVRRKKTRRKSGTRGVHHTQQQATPSRMPSQADIMPPLYFGGELFESLLVLKRFRRFQALTKTTP